MLRIALSAATIVALATMVGAYVLPAADEGSTVAPRELADADSMFVSVDGVDVHYKTTGAGDTTLILLHGFGAGEFTWREVAGPLAEYGTVIAYDRPGFGLTERPLQGEWAGTNPYSSAYQDDLLVALMDALEVEQAILVGNSAGGNVAAQAALAFPERVVGIVLVDASIYGYRAAEDALESVLSLPLVQTLGPTMAGSMAQIATHFADSAWHDPSKLSQDLRSAYRLQMRVDNWDYGFWEAGRVGLPDDLGDQVSEIDLPVLVITGDSDDVVPTRNSVRLAAELPDAQLAVLESCGHVPNEECPEAFLRATSGFLEALAKAANRS